MTRTEFDIEINRLAEGHEHRVSKIRGEAFYKKFGHVRREDLVQLVDQCLIEPRFPSSDVFGRVLEHIQQGRYQHEHVGRERDAKRLFSGEQSEVTPFGRFCGKATMTALNAPPGQFANVFANLLADWINEDPETRRQHESWLLEWIDQANDQAKKTTVSA